MTQYTKLTTQNTVNHCHRASLLMTAHQDHKVLGAQRAHPLESCALKNLSVDSWYLMCRIIADGRERL